MCDENGMIGIRPYVYGGGCSGMAHSMTFVDQIDGRDKEIAPYVYIDPIAYQFMEGATIHYDTAGMTPTFVISRCIQRTRWFRNLWWKRSSNRARL